VLANAAKWSAEVLKRGSEPLAGGPEHLIMFAVTLPIPNLVHLPSLTVATVEKALPRCAALCSCTSFVLSAAVLLLLQKSRRA
jgi:hypothetical protein